MRRNTHQMNVAATERLFDPTVRVVVRRSKDLLAVDDLAQWPFHLITAKTFGRVSFNVQPLRFAVYFTVSRE